MKVQTGRWGSSCAKLLDLMCFIIIIILNGPTPPSFSFIFGLFKQTLLQFLQQISVKNVHPVYGNGIRTHDLLNRSRHQ